MKDQEKLIEDAYLEVLGREPDEEGKKTNLDAIKSHSIDEIKNSMRQSPEYTDMFKSIVKGKIRKDIAYIGENGTIVWVCTAATETGNPTPHLSSSQKQVMLVSTWGIKCGIATYTSHLLNSVNKVQEIADIFPINNRESSYTVDAGIVHLQHEFGIMPAKLHSNSKVIVTFHTVPNNIITTLNHFESQYNIVGYIAHFEKGRDIISGETEKDVWMIPHGSKTIPCANATNIKQCAMEWLNFDKLGIKEGEDCAFMFGFQSGNKNVNRLISACKSVGIKLIISGGKHQCGFTNININGNQNDGTVIFLDKYLNDMETDLFALSSDILLFDYVPQDHYSCSGAMHRVIGAGRPVICSRTNHFTDVIENEQCLKFKDRAELESKIKEGLDRRDELSKNALQYAISTSWENAARQHLEIYKKYGA